MNIKAKPRFQKLIRKAPDLQTSLLIFAFTLAVFWLSPVHQVSDSRYSMLVSQGLISYGSFALDNYNIPRYEPFQREDYVMNG